jgi:hypothetical protein
VTYWDEYGDEPDDGEGDDDVEYFTDDEIAGTAVGAGIGGGGGDGGGPADDDGGDDDRRGGPRWLELVVALVAAIAVVALIVTLTSDDDDGDGDEVATQEDSTTSSSRRTTTTRATTTSSSSSTTIGVDPASPADGGGTTSTTKKGSGGSGGGTTSTTKKPSAPSGPIGTVYADKDPRCASGSSGGVKPPPAEWPMFWQTEPKVNDPTSISICVDDVSPAVGQLVTVELRGDDKDAVIDRGCGWWITFNGESGSLCGSTIPTEPQPTPAERFGGGFFAKKTFTYTGAGSFTIRGAVQSGTPGIVNPYSGEASASLTVQVHG